jgi:hypothetical protein
MAKHADGEERPHPLEQDACAKLVWPVTPITEVEPRTVSEMLWR